jgi:hypothetical protein
VRADLSEQFKEQEERARKENPDFELMREMWMQEQLQIGELANVLNTNSPYLFNFFDTHNLFIDVSPDVGISKEGDTCFYFLYQIFDETMNCLVNDREEAELARRKASFAAIDEAFKLLENKLA